MSNDVSSALKFNPRVAAAPIYMSDKSIEAAQATYGLREIIQLGSNESLLGPSPLALEAIQQAAGRLNRYPSMGDEDLREALAEAIGQGMAPDNFFTGNGGCDVLSMIAGSFLRSGNEVIICRPTFPVYDITARRAGANIVYVNLDPQHFTYNVEAILAAITNRTRLIYICSPNNPTGSTITAAQMETLVHNIPAHVLLIADEVYYHFATTQDFPNSLAYVRDGKNVIIIHSFSKAYGLAGLRLGYAITPPEIARYLARARESFHLSGLVLAGGMASLQDKAHLQKAIELTLAGRDWLYGRLTDLGVQAWPSQGNFILFKPPFPPAHLSERLLRRGLVVRPMTQFYLPGHMRVTIGLPAENEQFIAALSESLAEMEAEGVSKETGLEENRGEFKF